ncbi:type I methionyl aminopeptidase [Patescibacteria group bacterium]|nr:type I methionyl aminopeptidase [Patescibacteria group bacterium]MBU1500547.1 type I methionyl aminopeptidase [Patescibacteria group bacterium]MBU2080436.1 type I methionyl aminopeptidase [Patescibacteria group bacterium]MBU2123759.1 type I methionyl aminopeptidase [Patescibacteria group bacterium]MBU2194615.1 type I methionyl aminopeptidase [Patescibacteria group bacterium]
MIVRTSEEREGILESGRRLAAVLSKLENMVAPGVSVEDLDTEAERLIRETGDTPAFLHYTPEGARRPYPASLCVSVNEEVVHGLPNEAPRILKQGDVVSLDLGLTHKGFITDSAITVPVGKIAKNIQSLLDTTRASLEAGILAARPGNRIGDISYATGSAFKGTGFSVVKMLGGHAVGRAVHEEPFIANDGHPGTGPEIVAGMVLAIEPIANIGKAAVIIAPDGYTYRTKDGSVSAHFEHTILVEENETVVVTRREGEVY